MAWTRGCIVVLSLSVTACDPLVPLEEGTSGDTSAPPGSSEGGEAGSPTSPVPPTPSTTAPPSACDPGMAAQCSCPDGSYGVQVCEPGGVPGPCQCNDGETWGTTSGGWWGSSGSSGWWGESSGSSSGGWNDPRIPELPPGEECLGLDMPCAGSFDIYDDEQLQAVGICSRIDGELLIQNVSTLQPLGCLREMDGFLSVIQTPVSDLSGLAALEFAGSLGFAENHQLQTLDIPTLENVGDLYVFANPSLVSFDLPNLAEIIGVLDVINNPVLPDCEVQALFEQTTPTALTCGGNLPDMCATACD